MGGLGGESRISRMKVKTQRDRTGREKRWDLNTNWSSPLAVGEKASPKPGLSTLANGSHTKHELENQWKALLGEGVGMLFPPTGNQKGKKRVLQKHKGQTTNTVCLRKKETIAE